MTDQPNALTREFLVQRHQLLAFINGLVRNLHAAEEILQEVWIRLAEAEIKGVAIQSLEKWCRGVARNLILHYLRGQRTNRVVADTRVVELAEQAFEEYGADTIWSSRRNDLFACIEQLPEHSKELLRLKYNSSLRVAEIAERLRRSADAIMKALSRIRQMLNKCVEGRQAIEGD